MNLRSIGAGLLAATAVLAAPAVATAAPSGVPLPDAHAYCDTTLTSVASFAFASPLGDSFWIGSGPYAGKRNIGYEARYLAPGLIEEPAPLAISRRTGHTSSRGEKSFGQKTGQTDTVTCEIVSLGDLGPDSFTVFAPVVLSRTS
jgi:hypothetical protein